MPSLRFDGSLDLDATLNSGQAFRWTQEASGWFSGYIRGTPVRVQVAGSVLGWRGPGLEEQDLRSYFRLDASHAEFLQTVDRDANLAEALARYPGLRLLRQDPWETFIAFIVSQNSNIAKIRRTLESLARQASPAVDWEGRPWHPWPSPQALAGLDDSTLRATGMGYRAPHVHTAAAWVATGRLDLSRLERLGYEAAHEALLEVPGVGDKVADCIQLYGLGQLDAFPVDVWIQRVVREAFFPRRRMSHGDIGAWARRHYGRWAGYAQHLLFHHRRLGGPFLRTKVNHSARLRVAAASASSRSATKAGTGGQAKP